MIRDKYFGLSPRIARWKLTRKIEGWLGVKADKSEFWKKLYVLYYQLFDNKYYKVGVQMTKDAPSQHIHKISSAVRKSML